ncbi:MAG: hypothetical protein V1914_02460 [archaeon]
MGSVTLTISDETKEELNSFAWVIWSEVAGEEFRKKEIFEEYLKTGKLSDEDWKFCEKVDWHPVDELPLKEKFIKELEAARRESSIKLKSVSDIFK